MKKSDLKEFLDRQVERYNQSSFIEADPISIPHQFSKKQDIEISGFLAATISWGQRSVILRNSNLLLNKMDHAPHDFILNFSETDLRSFQSFVHRTFNGDDLIFFLKSLQKIYRSNSSMESLFSKKTPGDDYMESIGFLRKIFFANNEMHRSKKHFADPSAGSAAKRINMFLRWMIRKDNKGVDFGIWKSSPSLLVCPLDIHSGRVARKLGLLKRNINDWKAAKELTVQLRKFNANDPVSYDFALFGTGVTEKF